MRGFGMVEKERLSVTASEVSREKAKQFVDDYLKERQSIGATEKVFRHFEVYQEREEQKDSAAFGFNVVVHRGPLVEDSKSSPMTGWEFAVAEERHLAAKLAAELGRSAELAGQIEPNPIRVRPDAILKGADRLAGLLESAGYTPGLIVLATKLEVDLTVQLLKLLDTPDWDLPPELRTNWIFGRHHDRLLLYIRDATPSRIYAVDLPKFATLYQYAPAAELTIEDVSLSDAMRQSIVNHTNEVHLRLYQSYEVDVRDPRAVWAANLIEPEGA